MRALSSSACRTLALKGWNSSALRLGWAPVSRPSAPSPLGEPCNRVYSGVFLSSFRSPLVAAGCRPLFSPPLANEAPGTPSMGSWNHGAKVRPFPRLRKFSGHFFHGFQIETFPPLNRSTSRGTGRSGDGFGGVFPPAVAVVAVVAVILKP